MFIFLSFRSIAARKRKKNATKKKENLAQVYKLSLYDLIKISYFLKLAKLYSNIIAKAVITLLKHQKVFSEILIKSALCCA